MTRFYAFDFRKRHHLALAEQRIACPGVPAGQRVPRPRRGPVDDRRQLVAQTADGVQVVALVPSAGPVPPPDIVVTPPSIAVIACCGQI